MQSAALFIRVHFWDWERAPDDQQLTVPDHRPALLGDVVASAGYVWLALASEA